MGTIKENKGMNRENIKPYKAVVVGGGASGLLLAIRLAEKFGSASVLLVERLDRVGKKLLSTGNGQCNLGNVDGDFKHYHGNGGEFCREIISRYTNSVKSVFLSLGVPFTVDGEKVYPLSKQASSVVDALRFKLDGLGVKTQTGVKITSVKKSGGIFTLTDENNFSYFAENVVLCVGGKSQKHLGTDGSSYSLLTGFGHRLTELYPSIVQLKVKDLLRIKGLKGLKQKVSAKAVLDGVEVAESYGDLMFTDYGLSGNVAFYLSSYLSGKNGGVIEVDFCPELSRSALYDVLKTKRENCPYLSGEYLLSGIMNTKISASVLRNERVGNLSLKIDAFDLSKVVDAIKNYKIEISGTMGFDSSQVTKGGISVDGFDSLTLESKLVDNLYAAGEVLDVDGDCGGYNLNWAFCSALAVADGIL